MSNKLNFRAVISLVIGSQIGSGVFLLPATLAALGGASLFGWFFSGIGAILIALVFAKLSMIVTKGGGPHAYVEKAFGREAAFFMAWTYWLISWISSIAVIVAAVGYLSPLIGQVSPLANLFLEIAIVTSLTLVNIRGASTAGSFEVLLTLLKCTPLIIVPIAGLFFLKSEHFVFHAACSTEIISTISTATLITFWGFVGVETATATSNVIENPTKVIPRAVIFGTLVVAILYFFNSFSVMGVVPPSILAQSQAPYAEAAKLMFGNGWDVVIGLVGFLACIGTLNAWILTSGQIAAAAAKDGLFPPIFGKINARGSPIVSLLIPLFCMIPLLALTLTPNILGQLNVVIDMSVTIFLFIYLICSIAFCRIAFSNEAKLERAYFGIAFLAIAFCSLILMSSTIENFIVTALFILSGFPVYLLQRKNMHILPQRIDS